MFWRKKLKISLSCIGRNAWNKNLLGYHSGENHWNYQNGKSFEPYCEKFNNQKKEEIRNQYDRKCYVCNKDELENKYKSGKMIRLSIHHIDEDKQQGCNGKQWKLVTSCLHCHQKLHKGIKLSCLK